MFLLLMDFNTKHMKNLLKISLFVICLNVAARASAGVINPAPATESSNSHDSTIGIKSNIVIFKIVSTPVPPINNSNGSLKKAGKAARTSYSHTSIDTILYKRKGI